MRERRRMILMGVGVVIVVVGVCLGLKWGLKPSVEEPDSLVASEDEPGDVSENASEAAEPVGYVEKLVPTASGLEFVGQNYTLAFGRLMLINPVFTVGTDFIAARRDELIDMTAEYGVIEGMAGNGRPLIDPEAAPHLAEMINDYQVAHPGHNLETRSCFRMVGTQCGRLCYATGTSDHHTGYTCDLIDPAYGTELDTDFLDRHPEWQWLKENSWKYGFVDRFPLEWAGGPMSEPINMTAEGSTGVYETWHYRYVGLTAAREIAEGRYNEGRYDSLEHYLKATGRVGDLLAP